jgi:hypothetical protein
VAQDLDVAAHGQLLHRPLDAKPLCRHFRAADPKGIQARQPLLESAQEQSRQEIPRGFSGNQG